MFRRQLEDVGVGTGLLRRRRCVFRGDGATGGAGVAERRRQWRRIYPNVPNRGGKWDAAVHPNCERTNTSNHDRAGYPTPGLYFDLFGVE